MKQGQGRQSDGERGGDDAWLAEWWGGDDAWLAGWWGDGNCEQ